MTDSNFKYSFSTQAQGSCMHGGSTSVYPGPGAELQAVFCFISSFPFLLAFDVGGLGFEFCVFDAGWRHALQSEWPFFSYDLFVS